MAISRQTTVTVLVRASRRIGLLAALAAGFQGCYTGDSSETNGPSTDDASAEQDSENEETDDTALAEQAVLGGTVVANPDGPNAFIWAQLSSGAWKVCSGVLLTDQWVLTAKHCFGADQSPKRYDASVGSPYDPVRGTVTSPGVALHLHPDYDVALMQLERPLGAPNRVVGLYTGDSGSLVGRSLKAMGFGDYNTAGNSDDQLRAAWLPVQRVGGDFVEVVPNGHSQQVAPGDSGGTLFIPGIGTPPLVLGPLSVCYEERDWDADAVQDRCDYAAAWAFSPWALDIMYGKDRLTCHGPTCTTNSTALPDSWSAETTANPCNSACYRWTARYSFEPGYDYAQVGDYRLSGWNQVASGSGCGPVAVSVHTDYSVASPGLESLEFQCIHNDVGVIPSGTTCPTGAEDLIEVFTDDEDRRNANGRGGWRGSIVSDSNTTFRFCRVDGSQFRALTTDPGSTVQHYAVLQLGDECPNGSVSVSRYFDNEDSNNKNRKIGDLWPGSQIWTDKADGGKGGTRFNFCLFRGSAATMPTFPDFGFAYGVFADGSLPGALESGWLSTDDEDRNNNNSFDCGDVCTDASRIITADRNTTFRFARVR